MEQRNLILAITLSIAVLVGWQFFVEFFMPLPAQQAVEEQFAANGLPPLPPLPGAPAALAEPRGRVEVVTEAERVTINGPRVHGSINLTGGRFDDLTLADYRTTTDPQSAEIELLSPAGTQAPYYAEFGWIDDRGRDLGGAANWQTDRTTLDADGPVTLTWQSEDGLSFTREIAVDRDFMFTLTDRVENRGQETVNLLPYGRVRRVEQPETLGYFILHEGPLGVFNGALEEVDYEDVAEQRIIEQTSTGGWIGITDKYWLTALVPDQTEPMRARFVYSDSDGADSYQVDYLGRARNLAPGASVVFSSRLFAGAKEVRLLDGYRDNLGIERFDLAIDFGWFFYITKPIFYGMLYLDSWLGNFGLAILALTVGFKALFFPLANKSYKSMSRMKALQPQMLELRERFNEDKQKLQQEMMALYKREKVNPLSGCLPIVIQIPVFFALYKVLFVTIEMRHASFYGWIIDLSAPDPTTAFNLFGLIPWDPPSFLMIGAWPLIMGGTMFLQQKLNPAPPDPVQAKIFMLMPFFFTVLLASFPAGLVIYWAWNNTLSIAQQYVIMRRMGVTIGGQTVPAPAAPAAPAAKTKAAKPAATTPEAGDEADPEADIAPVHRDSATPSTRPLRKRSAGRRNGAKKRAGKRRASE